MFHLLTYLFAPIAVHAQTDETYGLGTTAGAAGLTRVVGTTGDISSFIGTLIGTGLSFIGIVFFILMLYGGFLWMTARGNEDQTSKAIGTITAGAIGMVIIMASYAITSFLFNSLTPGQSSINGAANQTGSGQLLCCVYRVGPPGCDPRTTAGCEDDGQVVSDSAACTALCMNSGGQRNNCTDVGTVASPGDCG